MTNPLPVPADAKTDAKNRAMRTFVQGLLTDVLTALVATVIAAMSNPDFIMSKPYLIALAVLVGKSMVMAACSYIMRYLKPPATT